MSTTPRKPAKEQSTAQGVAPSSGDWRVLMMLDRVVRGIACIAVLWLVGSMTLTMLNRPSFQMDSEPSTQENSEPSATSENSHSASGQETVQALTGQWQFAGAPWSVEVEQLTRDDAFARLQVPFTDHFLGKENSNSELEDVFNILDSLNALHFRGTG